MACRATQAGGVIVEGSDKSWSTGRGNGNLLKYSCLESPMDSMKTQKYIPTEYEPPPYPGREVSSILLGKRAITISSSKNEVAGPYKK